MDDNGGGMGYGRFLAMIATSTVVMLGLMYLNTYAVEHVFWSETRLWMAFVMGAAMAVVMLSFMQAMYRNRWANLAIFAGAVVVFAGALWLVRSQRTVDDVAYMKAMIPHHSIAVLTSERAHLRDPRTRALAEAIITAQRREIAEMRYLIAEIEEHGVRPVDGGAAPGGAADTGVDDGEDRGVGTEGRSAPDRGAGDAADDGAGPGGGRGPEGGAEGDGGAGRGGGPERDDGTEGDGGLEPVPPTGTEEP